MHAISAERPTHSDDPTDAAAAESTVELARRVQAGDERAAEQLLERLYPLVLKIVRSHLPPRGGEEDLCQMIFMRIFRRLDQYASRAPFEHWVSRIAVNVCLNQIKMERSRKELRFADLSEEQLAVVRHLGATPAELPESRSAAATELVALLMQRLSPRDRLLVTLLHLEERSIAEVHAITGWNTVLIKVRAFRARQKLQRAYHRLFPNLP